MDTLTRMFRAGETTEVIMEHIVKHCTHKVIARLKKLAAAFSKNDIWNTPNVFRMDESSAKSEQMIQRLRQRGYLSPTSRPVEAFDTFVREASSVTVNSSVDEIGRVMAFAYALSGEEAVLSEMISPGVLRRLRKVADYQRTCRIIRSVIQKRPRHEIDHLQVCGFLSFFLSLLPIPHISKFWE